MQRQIVTVEQFYKEHAAALQMRLLAGERGLKRVIREPTVNRPGLALSGFTRYFAYKRVQVMGNAEVYYLRSLTSARTREARYAYLFAFKIPCIVFSRGFKPDKEFLAAAEQAGVPVFQCPLVTMKFINPRRSRWKPCSRRAAPRWAAWWTSSAWACSFAARAASAKARRCWRSSSAATAWWPTT
jgi:hypothetical protein